MIGGSTVEMGKDMQVTIKGLSKENMQKKKKKEKETVTTQLPLHPIAGVACFVYLMHQKTCHSCKPL